MYTTFNHSVEAHIKMFTLATRAHEAPHATTTRDFGFGQDR